MCGLKYSILIYTFFFNSRIFFQTFILTEWTILLPVFGSVASKDFLMNFSSKNIFYILVKFFENL